MHTHTHFEDRQNLEKATLQNESNNDAVLKEKGKKHDEIKRWSKITIINM